MSRATILIADDSPDIRTVVRRSLNARGFDVVEAANGVEAINVARRCKPELVLLDICMPGLDGLTVASHLRTDPALEEVPIVAMTGYRTSATVRAARSAGCERVVCKPFDLETITNTIVTLTSPGSRSV